MHRNKQIDTKLKTPVLSLYLTSMVHKDHISTGMLLKITRLGIWRFARATHDATSTMSVVGMCVSWGGSCLKDA